MDLSNRTANRVLYSIICCTLKNRFIKQSFLDKGINQVANYRIKDRLMTYLLFSNCNLNVDKFHSARITFWVEMITQVGRDKRCITKCAKCVFLTCFLLHYCESLWKMPFFMLSHEYLKPQDLLEQLISKNFRSNPVYELKFNILHLQQSLHLYYTCCPFSVIMM